MAEASRAAGSSAVDRPGEADRRGGKGVHHGETPAAWVGSMLGLVAFVVGGVAMLLGPNWVLFSVAVVLAVVAMIATLVLRRLGHGAD